MKHGVSVSGAFPSAIMHLSFPLRHMMAQSALPFRMNSIAKTYRLKSLFRAVIMNTRSELFQSDLPQRTNQGAIKALYSAPGGANSTANAPLTRRERISFGGIRKHELAPGRVSGN